MGVFADALDAMDKALAERDAHINSLERELDEVLRELSETHRVNDDLENQIHEDGGFIDRIVELEEENALLKELLAFVVAPGRGGKIDRLVLAPVTASEIEADEDDD